MILFFNFLFLSLSSYSALPEFGALSCPGPGKVLFAVNDGSTFKKYCLIELSVKEKKIKWISYPLEEAYVKREPEHILDFGPAYMLIATTGENKNKELVSQVHLYNKSKYRLTMAAESQCGQASKIKITRKKIIFYCGSKINETEMKSSMTALFKLHIPKEGLVFDHQVYESSKEDWGFEIAETDDYFKDRLKISFKNAVLKEYNAKDFMRCFEYDTLQGSQNKLSE